MWVDVVAAADDAVADAELGDFACMCACVLEAGGGASGTGVDCEVNGTFYRRRQMCCCKKMSGRGPRCRHQTDQTAIKAVRHQARQAEGGWLLSRCCWLRSVQPNWINWNYWIRFPLPLPNGERSISTPPSAISWASSRGDQGHAHDGSRDGEDLVLSTPLVPNRPSCAPSRALPGR